MTSIFDLKTSTSQLASQNQSMSDLRYVQKPPTRAIINNFAGGAIHFRFEMSGPNYWIPARSYIKIKMKLTQQDGVTALNNADEIAINMGVCGNLFTSGEMRLEGQVISRIDSYMAQVDALKTRLSKPKAWLDSIGASVNFWQAAQNERKNAVTADGSVLIAETPQSDVTTGRAAMGFAPAGGINALANDNWAYTAATGELDYLIGAVLTGRNPAQASAEYPVGSYFKYVGVANTPEVEMKVLSNDNAGALVVEPLLNVDVAADGRFDFNRVVKSSAVGGPARRVKDFECIWIPPLSIFDVGHAMGVGSYELVLNPEQLGSYKQRAIESFGANKVPGAGNDYDFEVTDMFLYIAQVEGKRMDNLTYYLDLEEINCQLKQTSGGAGGLQQHQFDVNKKSHKLTCAFQDVSAGSDTQYSASKFKVRTDNELTLTRLFLNYSGTSRPSPDADPEYDETKNTDRTAQRYIDSMIAGGTYYESGGAESIQEFHQRGSYYHFLWPRDRDDSSTSVNTNFTLGTATDTNVLLFDHYRKAVQVEVSNGRVQNVRTQE